jgi:hypothetical protein
MIEPDRSQMTIQYDAEMIYACQVIWQKYTLINLLLIALHNMGHLNMPQMLHYTYITCLVNNNVLFIKHFFSLIFYASP